MFGSCDLEHLEGRVSILNSVIMFRIKVKLKLLLWWRYFARYWTLCTGTEKMKVSQIVADGWKRPSKQVRIRAVMAVGKHVNIKLFVAFELRQMVSWLKFTSMKLDEAIEFSDDHQVMFPPFSFFADFVVSQSYKVNHPIAFEGEGELPGVHRKVIQKPLNLVMLFAILCHCLLLEMFMLRMIRVQLLILNPINKVNSASESSP